jgi:deazaflavin-dependent oxidoreductase (nitroreductase family)
MGSSFIGHLITLGRKTGKQHTVPLRLVLYDGKYYASRRNFNGDWLKNIMKNPSVTLEIEGRRIAGRASVIKDEELSKKISSLKYGDERATMSRIVVEITPL